MILLRNKPVDHLEHDLACGVALGFFEHRLVRVTLEAVTVYDDRMQVRRLEPNWLDSHDALDAATREYLAARRDISRGSSYGSSYGAWSVSAAAKAREVGLARAIAAKARARQLLMERNAWARATTAGLNILD